MIQVFIALSSWFAFFLIVEKMGERQLAISNLTRNVYMLLMICLMGFSNATNTIVSNMIGQDKRKQIESVVKRIIKMSALTTLSVVVLNLLAWRYSVLLFTNDQELVEATFGCILIISGSSLFFAVSYVLLSVVSGSGGTLATLLIEASTLVFYLFATYLTAILFRCRIEIVWGTEYVYFIAMGILSYFYMKKKVVVNIKN